MKTSTSALALALALLPATAWAECKTSSLNGDWRAYVQLSAVGLTGTANHICSLTISGGEVTFIDCHQEVPEAEFTVTSAFFNITDKCQITGNISGNQGDVSAGVNIDATLDRSRQTALGFTLPSNPVPLVPFGYLPTFAMVKAPVILPKEW